MNLTSDEHKALTREAKRRGVSISDLARDVIQRFLARAGKKTPR